MPDGAGLIRVSGGVIDTSSGTPTFYPTGGGSLLSGNTGGYSSSWGLGPTFLNPSAMQLGGTYTPPTVTSNVSYGGGGSAALTGNPAFDAERNEIEQNGTGMTYRVSGVPGFGNITQDISVSGGGGIVGTLKSPSFWLQVLVVVVGGLAVFWLSKGKAR